MKTNIDFFKVWGGISGVQHSLPVLLKTGVGTGRLSLSQVSGLLSARVADSFGVESKGRLREGCDADLVLLDPDAVFTVTADQLHYTHQVSPYIGKELQGRIDQVWLRGETIWQDGSAGLNRNGKWIKVKRG